MLAGTLAVMTAFTPMDTAAAQTVAVEQTADKAQAETTYTVSFDANKGKKVKKTLLLSYKDTYGSLPKTTRDGYVFQGWYTKKTGGTKVTSKTVFKAKADKVLYAHWKKAVVEETENSETEALAEETQASATAALSEVFQPAEQNTESSQEQSEVSQQAEQKTGAEVSQTADQKTDPEASQTTEQKEETGLPQTSDTEEAGTAKEGQSEKSDTQTGFSSAGSVLVNYSSNIKTDYKQNNYSGFLVLKNFKPKYLYCQFDYKRFIGSSGKNVGCTATADAMLASIYMDKPFSPNDEGWIPGEGATWTNSVVADGTKSYSVKRQCQVVYDYLNQGKPALIRVVGHSVTAIGLRKGADRVTITPADILIADPADGKVKCANEMGYRVMKNANGWGIRIPKASLVAK